MAKIAWLDDFRLDERQGGAERSSTQMIYIGQSEYSHVIDIITSRTRPRPIADYDLFVLNNVHTFSQKTFEKLITHNARFVTFMRDYNFCNQRTAMHDCTYFCRVKEWKELFARSLHNFFLSPKQLRLYQQYFTLAPEKVSLVLPPVDGADFPFSSDVRKNQVLIFSGPPHKGADIAVERHPDHLLVEDAPYEEVGRLLREHSSVAMYPRWVEPCGRLAIEACLSGCEVLCNNNIGFFSWPIDFKSRQAIVDKISETTKHFWYTIQACCE